MAEDAQVLVEPQAHVPPGHRWNPVSAGETELLLTHKIKDPASRVSIRDSASSILGRAIPPGRAAGQETGLVIGYVQSGKTLSFTTVTALARDNGYQIVIVVTGISVQLFDQSLRRLRDDLQVNAERMRTWALFSNPADTEGTRGNIQRFLDEWRDPEVPLEERQTILIPVMKNHNHLQNLIALLQSLNLQGLAALIVDDEADQASLNNEVTQADQSTTYRRLLELKACLPNHTYLQYTATPQAPLLINIIDSLSPNFVEVLEPGGDYVGGAEFFEGNSQLVRVIPADEVPRNDNPLTAPPDTLIEALRIFMVGVAAGICTNQGVGNRSMLVHPSHRTSQHQEFYQWISEILENWKRILSLPATDPDLQELLADFQIAHEDLSETADNLPTFDQIQAALKRAFNRTSMLEVNRREGRAQIVDWRQSYGWILVGGQAMDRGFTVEGLTVTYMPRGIGVGNADTVQQRGRFFGYKRQYLGYCRVYLEAQTLQAFRSYVEHEEDIRTQLDAVKANAQPLDTWKRTFLLSPQLRPCRDSVLEFDYMRGRYSDSWYSPQVVLLADQIIRSNRDAVQRFLQNKPFQPDAGHNDRTPVQRHEICVGIPLGDVLRDLFVQLRTVGQTDSQKYTGLLLQLRKALDNNANEVCAVYRMSPAVARSRSVDDSGEISNLFQGEYPVEPRNLRGSIYPGDRAIRHPDTVSIQIHSLVLERDGAAQAREVPVVAVWVPRRLGAAWVAQQQPGA